MLQILFSPQTGGSRESRFDRAPTRGSFQPHPWEGKQPGNGSAPAGGPPGAWAPVNKSATGTWGHIDAPQQERWASIDHSRGQPGINIGHPPAIGPPTMGIFPGVPGGEMINTIAGHFPIERFNPNMMRRF